MSADPQVFLAGAVTMGFAVGGLFFLRFWTRTGDRLFVAFATAFWLLGLQQGLQSFTCGDATEKAPLYLLRILAFGIIIAAVLGKNFNRKS